MKFVLCVILLPLVTSLHLTRREDRELRKTCGRHHFRPDIFDIFRFKSYKGRLVSPNEYPWLVTLYYDGNSDLSRCTGVAISSRHILTAAHCIITSAKEIGTQEKCRGYRNDRKLNSKHTWISDRRECPVPKRGQYCEKHLAKGMKVYPGYNECTYENDLAVLEISSNLPQNHLVPICMPWHREKLSRVLQAAGSGRVQPPQRGGKWYGYNLVYMTLRVESENVIETLTTGGASMCKGDSGGPLFQSDVHDIHTVVGVLSGSNGCNDTKRAEPPFTNRYTDVRKYLKWICEVTGVCYPIFDYKNYEKSEEDVLDLDYTYN